MTPQDRAEQAAVATIAHEVAPRLRQAVILATRGASGQNRNLTIEAQINAMQTLLSEAQRMLIIADLRLQGREVRG